jgi:sugar lactone lactonase YvrE
VRSLPEWRGKYLHLAMRRGRKIAKVAMAWKLAVCLYWMWRKGWNYEQLIKFGSLAGKSGTGHGVQSNTELAGWPRVRLNKARPDPSGSLWVGSMQNNVNPDGSACPMDGNHGVLVRLDPGGKVTAHKTDIGISNTLAWSPDRRHLYFADTLANTIWAYDYDPATRNIGNERSFFQDFARGQPDGSTVDAEGYLWNCRYSGACIVPVAPNGEIDRVVEIPSQNITTCTFGGPDRKTLYATTAAAGAPPGDRLAGGLYAIHTTVSGLPENRFVFSVHKPEVYQHSNCCDRGIGLDFSLSMKG